MRRRAAGRIARPRIDPARMTFQRTATYRRYDGAIDPDRLDPEQLYSKALIHEQGFDGLPHVVSGQELAAFVQAGEMELYRGIAGTLAAEYAEQLRSGLLWVGRGGLGGGIYAAIGPDARSHAAEYAQEPGSVLIRMTVKTGARLVRVEEVEALLRRDVGRTLPPGTRAGIIAAYLAYDGIVDPHEGVMLVLNRTALRIQRENLKP
jgi:hypothetical protein